MNQIVINQYWSNLPTSSIDKKRTLKRKLKRMEIKQGSKYSEVYIQRIKQFLNSRDQANVELAFYILKGNGIPPELHKTLTTGKKVLLCLEHGFLDIVGNIQSLDWEDCDLKELPTDIKHLKNLRDLYLEYNHLKEFPPEITQLTKLREINISENEFASIPASIGKLDQLEELKLSGNRLTTLPPEIGNLSKLQYIGLSNNKITTLPQEFAKLQNLEYLGFSNNELTKLPSEIYQLPRLKKITLYGNHFSHEEIKKINRHLPDTYVRFR